MLMLLQREHDIGWRRHFPLPGEPVFAFPKQKVAGFWHGWPKCYTHPKTNRVL